MKKHAILFLSLALVVLCLSCSKDKTDDPQELSGGQSPIGAIGVTVSSSSSEIAGVSDFNAVVTGLTDGVSAYSASATVTNDLFKNMLSNFPGVSVNGDVVTIADMRIQQTTGGIKCLTGPSAGILVNYESSVGDTYPFGSTGNVRTVVSKSTTDDYAYGFYMIKTIQVAMNPPSALKSSGISKFTFVANHKFGLVGVKVDFDDKSQVTFPVYSSATN